MNDQDKLIDLLDKAERLVSQFTGGYSNNSYQLKNFMQHFQMQ